MYKLWHGSLLKRILLSFALFGFVTVCVTESIQGKAEDGWHYRASEVKNIQKIYPDADAVILHQSTTIEVDENGLQTRTFARRVVLFTDNAIRRYGDPRILFDSSTQELDVSVARVYMRDGTAVDCTKNAFNPTTPFPLALAPDYSRWQEMVVTHLGIEKECVAELNYIIRDTEKRKPWLSGVEHLAADDPVLSCELTIVVPEGIALQYSSSNGVTEPAFISPGTYRWSAEDIPAIPPISTGIWRGDFIPTVFFTTAGSWEEVAGYIARMFDIRVGLHSSPMKDEESVIGEEDILKIHDEVREGVRSVHAPFEIFDMAPRKAEQIYQSAYAHSLDHAVLLHSKLEEEGVTSMPVLVSAGRSWYRNVPMYDVFDRVILEVRANDTGEVVLLDPEKAFEGDLRITIPGRRLMRCDNQGKIMSVPEGEAGANRNALDLVLTVTGGGTLAGEGTVSMNGAFSPYYSIRGVRSETEDYIKNKVKDLFPNASVQTWSIKALEKDRVELGFQFEADMPEKTKDGRIYFEIPEPFDADRSHIGSIPIERMEYPAPVSVMPCELAVSVAFDNVSDWALASSTLNANEHNTVGSVQTAVEKQSKDESIRFVCSKSLTIGKSVVPSEEYPQLRSLLLKFAEEQVVFQNNGSR